MFAFSKIQGKVGNYCELMNLQKIIYKYGLIKQQIIFTQAFNKVLIQLTRAIKSKLQKKPENQFLRLQIQAGEGCQGFTYKFKFDKTLSENDYVYKLNSNQSQNEKVVFAANGNQIKLLKGSVIDYSQQMMREVFYVKENPNAEISCSCKTSFSPKDYLL